MSPQAATGDVVQLQAGTPVLVRLPDKDVLLDSQIDAVDGNGLLMIRVPFTHPRPIRGEVLTVEWGGNRGWYSVQAAFDGPLRPNREHWVLRPVGAAHLMQRRNYARAQIGLPVVLVHDTESGPRTLNGTLLDVSEGGARSVVPSPAEIPVGARVVTMLTSERLRLVAAGQVVRHRPRGRTLEELSVAFTQPVPHAAELRREVLRWQQRERMARAR